MPSNNTFPQQQHTHSTLNKFGIGSLLHGHQSENTHPRRNAMNKNEVKLILNVFVILMFWFLRPRALHLLTVVVMVYS